MFEAILLGVLTSMVVQRTPLLLTALGEIVDQRAGTLNLGLEGLMLVGAICGFITVQNTGNIFLGFLVGGLAGGGLAIIHGFLTISFRVHQVICGLALNMFASGLSGFIGRNYLGQAMSVSMKSYAIPLLSDIPYIGQVFFNTDLMVYFTYLLVPLLTFFLFKTQAGLRLRACGENPSAAYSRGIHVNRTRYLAVVFGGFMAGMGGAYLVFKAVPTWVEGLTGGRGWIALAVVTVAMWKPSVALIAAFLYGCVESLAYQLQGIGVGVPAVILKMLPYVFTVLAMWIVSIRSKKNGIVGPAASGSAFVPEEG